MADNEDFRGETQGHEFVLAVDVEEDAIVPDPTTSIAVDDPDTRKLTTAPRWLFETPEAIRQFLDHTYSYEHYEALAERAKKLIETKIKQLRDQNGDEVQAKLTCRAKTKESLEEKLKMREVESGRPYKNDGDIELDVKDLAGVRIVLYTPTQAQHDSVKEMIVGIWGSEVIEKKHDGANSPSTSKQGQVDAQKKRGYVRKHFGYQAMHYRAPMRKEQEPRDGYKYKKNDWVEIQVVSALGHAWAEAGHDVQYKSYAFGPPTEREERVLDALSGLVSTGDLLLEEFRALVNTRTYAKWKVEEEFAIFLRQTDVLEKPRDERSEERRGDLKVIDEDYRGDFRRDTRDIVFGFLLCIGKNYPLAVRNALMANLGYNHNPIKSLEDMKKRKENQNLAIPISEPQLNLPKGVLAPFCLIVALLSKYDQESKTSGGDQLDMDTPHEPTMAEKCLIMMDVLLLLQTFAGSPWMARLFILKTNFKENEARGLNFVLRNPHRSTLFTPDTHEKTTWTEEFLEPAWQWFQRQLQDPASLWVFFFRLAKMGVFKEKDELQRLKELKIEPF